MKYEKKSDMFYDGEEYLKNEEAILEQKLSSQRLFFCIWNNPSLVLGFNQDEKGGVDLDFCRNNNIKILRRLSGGTGVFYNMDISFSLMLPTKHRYSKGIHLLYKKVLEWLSITLKDFHIDAVPYKHHGDKTLNPSSFCFEHPTFESLMVSGKKVAGCAQVRRASCILIHGLILFEPDIFLHSRIFNIPEERIKKSITGIGKIDRNALILNLQQKAHLFFS